MNTDARHNTDPFLNVDEVADYLGTCARFVWHEIKRERLTATRLGRLVRVRRSELEHYISANATMSHRGSES